MHDTAIHVEVEHGTARIFGNEFLLGVGQICHAMLERHILKFTMSVRIAHRAVERMHRQVFLNGFLPGKEEILSFGTDHHSRRRLGGTRPNGSFLPLLHHQAHTARAERVECVVVAHGRDNLACHCDDVVQRHPVLCRDGFPINAQFDRCRFNVWISSRLQAHNSSP
jgi:hypothetical protein